MEATSVFYGVCPQPARNSWRNCCFLRGLFRGNSQCNSGCFLCGLFTGYIAGQLLLFFFANSLQPTQASAVLAHGQIQFASVFFKYIYIFLKKIYTLNIILQASLQMTPAPWLLPPDLLKYTASSTNVTKCEWTRCMFLKKKTKFTWSTDVSQGTAHLPYKYRDTMNY
jgi:hypothetical protein